jgi:type IV pilus assembly protein PilE
MNDTTFVERRLAASRRRMRGVTLIELMIVVVVVAILTTVAYPSYRGYVMRTNRADGKSALLSASQQLERCFTRFNAYNNGGCPIATPLGGAGVPSPDGKYVVTFTAAPTASAFSLTATPQAAQANDTKCANLTLTHTGTRGASGSLPADCW